MIPGGAVSGLPSTPIQTPPQSRGNSLPSGQLLASLLTRPEKDFIVSDASYPPAGWYADPAASGSVRYWNGTAWTEHTAPHNPVPSPVSPVASATAQPAGFGSAPYAQPAGTETSYRDPAAYAPLQSHSPYPGPQYVVAGPPKNGKATRALVWGIVSLFINPFALPSVLAIVFGAQSRTTADQMERAGLVDSGRGRATAGLVLGCIGAAFFVVWMVFYISQLNWHGPAQAG